MSLPGIFTITSWAGDGSVAVLIADVVGHGTSAAIMTGIVKAAFRASHVDAFFPPTAVIDRVRKETRSPTERF